MSAPLHLRDCPCCHKPAHPEGESGPILTAEVMIDPGSGLPLYEIGYTVRCVDCGASVSHEYQSVTVRLWNGEPEPKDEEGDE